jgi:GntR family transcriptional regulator/MocR family aminotransferase
MSRAYHDRRKTIDLALAEHGLTVAGAGSFGGSALWMRAPEHVDTRVLAQRLAEKSVLIEPGHSFFSGPSAPNNFYRLAYSSIPTPRIAGGVEILAKTLAEIS